MKGTKKSEIRENEKIVKTVRHHPSILLPQLLVCTAVLILDFFLMYFLLLQGLWGMILFFSVAGLGIFYIARIIFLFKRNKFVFTDRRIIDFEQAGFFDRAIYEIPYSKIISIDVKMRGPFASIFKYGNIRLKLSERTVPLELFRIPDPMAFQALINKLRPVSIEEPAEVKPKKSALTEILAEIEPLAIEEKEEILRQLEQMLLEESASDG
ncbi:PH domain-containing protein [Patescibacteria group bacterium]|nr:PH domain-containing protein [Patescibacteria group bacterium]